MEPFSTLGQLSYAPATQTTVVTTTTTTTTSFPPMLFKPPRHLHDRDPKQYPLASSPTPQALKSFCFDVNGKPAWFREAEQPEQTLREAQNQYAALQAHGPLRSITNSEVQYHNPTRTSKIPSKHKILPSNPTTRGMKRSSSPVSISEAAEIVGLHRRIKKSRSSLRDGAELEDRRGLGSYETSSLDNTAPATPDTDTGSFRLPGGKQRMRRATNLRASTSYKPTSPKTYPHPPPSPHYDHTQDAQLDISSVDEPVPFPDAPAQVVATTPPIADSDLENFQRFEGAAPVSRRSHRPRALDTIGLQDASLPSPSLSPITAAANLAGQLRQPGGPLGIVEDSEEDEFPDLMDEDKEDLSRQGLYQRRTSAIAKTIDLPKHGQNGPNPQLFTPTAMDIPAMLESFDNMATEMQSYVMFQLLRRCAKPSLHLIADLVNPVLKCDFLGSLPLELSENVIKFLDARSMCRASQVSKKWRQVIDSDEKAWKVALADDGFKIPTSEVQRAVKEGWGWQISNGIHGFEADLSNAKSQPDAEAPPTTPVFADAESTYTSSGNRGRKRKSGAKHAGSKRQKTKATSSKTTIAPWLEKVGVSQGPNADANAALLAVPNPDVGLPSLQNLHLYKSLYARNHLIGKGWMHNELKPHHLAFRAHQRHVVTCLQFDTEKIITGSDDTNIHVYDTKTGRKKLSLEGHEGGVWALQYEGNILVSGSTDRSVRVWDLSTGKCLQVFHGHTSTVRCLVILKPTQVDTDEDGNPVMMPKEPIIITGSRDSTLRVWKLPQSKDSRVHSSETNSSENPYFIRSLTGHHHSVRAIAAHGDTLVSGSYDSSVRVWQISTGDLRWRLQGHTSKVYSVVLDHGRNRCISGSMDNIVKVWSLDNGTCLFNLEGHTSLVGLLDLSHERLVSAAADSTLRIWDPENGQCKSTLTAHTGAITCFQHDGQKVISGSDRTLKMWNVKTGECVKDLLTDLSGVWQVRFNERRCVAAVQRNDQTYIEVLDFGASRDGVPTEQLGVRILVDQDGRRIEELDDTDESVTT
ncbi:WD40 repeat-like protein [Aulographum hederae CBS 113979]|uniref:WD40 repeat-like protein n=1 Tax=Aulographum hederae CBS 113979 TaxID=1176131 RepID=A0A6G1HFX1_9PEZI|nr:WD40 repeat-like protein [Aulographum hederae CBS 113979]